VDERNENRGVDADKIDGLIERLSKIDDLDELNAVMDGMAMAGGPEFDALVERMGELSQRMMRDAAVNMALLAQAMGNDNGETGVARNTGENARV